MKFLPLIWSGIWRKPGRTILIFLQVGVAFALFGVLQGLKTGVEHLIAEARADLLLVHGRLSFADPLPLSLLEEMKSVPGVKAVVPVELFGATYQNPTQKMVVVAIRPDEGWLVGVHLHDGARIRRGIPEVADGSHHQSGTGEESTAGKSAIASPSSQPLTQRDGSTDWAFDVVGTFTDSDLGGGGDIMLINYDYLDEARVAGQGHGQPFQRRGFRSDNWR